MDEIAFGRYRLIALIGEGGMGKVYQAHDTVMGRDVAVKVLPPDLASQPGYEQRFRREASTAARLTEPHIIPIFDAGEIDGRLYLVMPIINGIDVQTLLRRDGPMSPQRAVLVIEQLAAALNAAHQHGLVHRDIKPSNALVTDDDFVYLIDFGITHDAAATRLTSTGMMVGTLAYMAPERFAAGTTDGRSDVYSLACMLYECLTGTTPYPGESMEQQIAGHLTLKPPKLSVANPGLAGFDEVIATGMAKDPNERYQAARDLAIAARKALTAVSSSAPDLQGALAPVAVSTPPAATLAPRPRPAEPTATADEQPQQETKLAPARQVIERGRLGVLTKIGQGGQGVVYGAPNARTKFAASMVYKEYKRVTLADIDFAALAAMPALVEDSLTYDQAERLISFAAWPCALVEDASKATGFVMPAIPNEFFIDLTTVKGVSRTTAEVQHVLNHVSVLAARGVTIDDAQRYSLLREVASALAFLHKHGVCVGDISPKNLLFSLAPHAAVYFIDCDAMRINRVSALPQMETPGWEAPSGEELATIYTDTYKLGLLALRLLAGDHDTKNLQHLPSNTPDMLRQIITDTLKIQPHSRPLPEAWTYVLGNAIEQAKYRQKNAAATPVSVALDAPPVPVVHSRPSAPQSRPPRRPPAPPASPQLMSRPPAGAPSSSKAPIWIGVGVAILALIAVIVSVAALTNRNSSSSSRATVTSTESSSYPPNSYPTSTAAAATDTPTASVPPPDLVQVADSHGVNCQGGYHLTNRSGWATNSGRGSVETSCGFADSVLRAYWDTYPTPSRDSRQVIAAGTVSCPEVSANTGVAIPCSGNDFIMTCASMGTDPWITCTGGHDAKVYIYYPVRFQGSQWHSIRRSLIHPHCVGATDCDQPRDGKPSAAWAPRCSW